MNQEKTSNQKSMVGVVSSDKMERTVTVKVTTFKVHPLYHKRYRWTTKYLTDTGEFQPKVGDSVRIESTRPMSKHKRWVVAEIINHSAPAKPKTAAKKSTTRKTAK